MALLILHPNLQEIYNISKNELNARTILGNFDYYQQKGLVKEITDEQFNALTLNQKVFDRLEGNNVIFKDNQRPPEGLGPETKEELDSLIQTITENFNMVLKKKDFSNNPQFKQEIENYLTVLANLDTNSITYPLGITLTEYVENNNLGTPIHPLHF